MAGLIEKNAKTPITIRIAGEIIDGQPSFENHPAMAMVFESSQSTSDSCCNRHTAHATAI